MKPFALESKMLTMTGVFYPTGHVFLMFPDPDLARQAAQRLLDGGLSGEAISVLTPETILTDIAGTIGEGDVPSAGTEADTVRQYIDLARQGHHALMVHAPSAAETERVMELLKGLSISYAQKYRTLVIEDLA